MKSHCCSRRKVFSNVFETLSPNSSRVGLKTRLPWKLTISLGRGVLLSCDRFLTIGSKKVAEGNRHVCLWKHIATAAFIYGPIKLDIPHSSLLSVLKETHASSSKIKQYSVPKTTLFLRSHPARAWLLLRTVQQKHVYVQSSGARLIDSGVDSTERHVSQICKNPNSWVS